MNTLGFTLASALAAASTLSAQTISVNFQINNNDANSVDSDETAGFGANASGNWNNVQLGGGGLFNSSNAASLQDDSATAGAATLSTNMASPFGRYHDTTGANRAVTGDAGLYQSSLYFGGGNNPGETLAVSGLGSEYTRGGYTVILYFSYSETGNSPASRTYGFTIDDGVIGSPQTFYTADTKALDSDRNPDDGVIEYLLATGTGIGSATAEANYAIFTGLTDSSFAIEGVSAGDRATLSGFQIVAIPEPTSFALAIGTLATGFLVNRRRRGR